MTNSKSITFTAVLFFAAGGLIWLSGCGQPNQQPPTSQAPTDHDHDHSHDHAHSHDHDHGHGPIDNDVIAAELAKLSPQDRALAEKQKVCVVAGEPLGSMGIPVKLSVAGREVFICCAGCEGSLRKDPEKYLSKLDE